MAAMQTQWAWLVQLTTICLETHLKNAAEYHRVGSKLLAITPNNCA